MKKVALLIGILLSFQSFAQLGVVEILQNNLRVHDSRDNICSFSVDSGAFSYSCDGKKLNSLNLSKFKAIMIQSALLNVMLDKGYYLKSSDLRGQRYLFFKNGI